MLQMTRAKQTARKSTAHSPPSGGKATRKQLVVTAARKSQPSSGRAAKRLIMPRSRLSSGNGGSCDLGSAGGDGGSGGGDGGSGGVSCGPEAIRRQCSVAIDPGDAALQACKVGMQVSSWLLPPSPAPGKDIAKRLRDTLLLSR